MTLPIAAISGLVEVGKGLISRIWPDPNEQAEQLHKLAELEQKGDLAELQAYIQVLQGRISIIKAEATSEHWLTANWRPITMLTFVALIVLRMFGLTDESITDAEYIKLWELVQLGLGGYVVSRGAEKVAKVVKAKN